jgi:uncharacterized protein YjbJ (UPF0337 family)
MQQAVRARELMKIDYRERNGVSEGGVKQRSVRMSTVDKAKNKAQEVKGHAKEAAGKATKDRSLEAKGKKDQVAGNLKQAGENVKDAVK